MKTNSVERVAGEGGLPKWRIENDFATAEVYEHGAHLTHWQPKNQEPVLWLSAQSQWALDKPIRGGVPICFPWFGPKSDDADAPAHGIARIGDWRLNSSAQNEICTTLVFEPDDAMRANAFWPDGCEVEYRVAIGEQLEMSFSVCNNEQSAFDFELAFEIALHTYLSVGDARQIQVHGLEHLRYFDKVAQSQCDADLAPIRIEGEIDRVYFDSCEECVIVDPLKNRQIIIGKSGSQSTIVWNPHIRKSAAMSDFGDDEWTQMVCVETANVGANALRLEAGETHAITSVVSLKF